MKFNSQEIIVGFVMLGIGIASVWRAFTYADPMAKEYPTLTTTFVPILWGGFLLLLSVIFILGKLAQRRREQKETAGGPAGTEERAPAGSGKTGEAPEAGEAEEARGTAGAGEGKSARAETIIGEDVKPLPLWIAVAGTAVMLVLYVWLLKRVNFALISTLMAFGLFSLYKATKKWWHNALIAIVSGICVHLLFVVLMGIPL
jgi:hypothetical protein